VLPSEDFFGIARSETWELFGVSKIKKWKKIIPQRISIFFASLKALSKILNEPTLFKSTKANITFDKKLF